MTESSADQGRIPSDGLLERARTSGRVVSRFFQADLAKMDEAANRLEAGHPQRPIRAEFKPLTLKGRESFPHTQASGSTTLALDYEDGTIIRAWQTVTEIDDPFNDTLIRETDTYKDYYVDYIGDGGVLHMEITDAIRGKFTFNGQPTPDSELTEEVVVALEDFADKVRPMSDTVLVS